MRCLSLKFFIYLLVASLAFPHGSHALGTEYESSSLVSVDPETMVSTPKITPKQIREFLTNLEKNLPDEIPYLVRETAAEAEQNTDTYLSRVEFLPPLGGKIIARKSNQTLEVVCVEDSTELAKCKRIQYRKNGQDLVGDVYLIKKKKKEVFLEYISNLLDKEQLKRNEAARDTSSWLGLADVPMIEKHADRYKGEITGWNTAGAIFVTIVWGGALGALLAYGALELWTISETAMWIIGVSTPLAVLVGPFVLGFLLLAFGNTFVGGYKAYKAAQHLSVKTANSLHYKKLGSRIRKATTKMFEPNSESMKISEKNFCKLLEMVGAT